MARKTFEELKKQFESAGPNVYEGGKQGAASQCAVFGEIGRLGTEGNEQALHFIAEHLTHENPFLRYSAVGYLGETPEEHLKHANINAIQKLETLVASEKDEVILRFMKRIILTKKTRKDP